MNRRTLIEKFGIGAIIAPILGGAVDQSAAAELIEVPRVRPVEPFTRIPEPIGLGCIKQASVQLTMNDGSLRQIDIPFPSPHWANRAETIKPSDCLHMSLEFRRYFGGVSPSDTEYIGSLSGGAEIR